MSSDMKHHSSLEAGLLRKQQEEEKLQRSVRGFGDRTLGQPDTCPGAQEKRKMSTFRRFLIIAFIGLVALMGLAAAGGPCLSAVQHHAVQLEKRQVSGSNTTTPPANSNQANDGTNTGTTHTVENTVTSTVVTTQTVHQSDSSTPTAPSSTASSEPGSSPPSSAPPSSSQPSQPSQPASSSTPSAPVTSSNPPASTPTTQPAPSSTKSTSQSNPPPVSTSTEPTSSSSETTARRTITTGTITTSSAVQETITRTDGNGRVETITSTSWVEIRPSSTGSTDPSLQNAANGRGTAGFAAAAVAGIIAGAMI
ncbi:hypothetical protein CCM_07705 [Cordyceps militaris CM01]|uniref:Uncharacterized protein n=1 Tax=Cordyceps militaris (strain CM01) TaxID=983644 RepID=G3JQE9_CORMM|nr:uncharacterized protein CCM_07705 [Cordyceps militaris CM01]EGX89453.1 hypothetical protein CCM_07705 [Cordyceps militaris CM01]